MRASLLVLLLLLIVPSAVAAETGQKLELSPCRVPGGSEVVRCGRLVIPENWYQPQGRKIALNVVVMPMIGRGPEQAPVFWLEGGPGVPGTISAALYSTDLKFHRERRAVVLFDQRGTGQSAPLHCPEIENRPALAEMYSASAVLGCRRTLEAHANLAQYTTANSARDLDAIRAALGYEKVDLMGLSYGTQLGQAYMKLYPSRVRAAAFIGSVPLGEKLPLHHAANGALALKQVFEDCREDRSCHAAFPQLAADWSHLTQNLSRSPVRISSAKGQVVIQPGPFGEAVRDLLNTTPGQRHLPSIISRAARGDFGPFLAAVATTGFPGTEGLYLSITCPEGTRRIRREEIARDAGTTFFGRYRVDQQIRACSLWTPNKLDARLLSPVKSDIPVLFLSGGRDATTPTSWAREIASQLPQSRVVVIEPMAHLPVGLQNMVCLDRIADAFFAKGTTKGLDTSCVGSMTPPAFLLK